MPSELEKTASVITSIIGVDVPPSTLSYAIAKAQVAAKQIFRTPELGSQERVTASNVAKALSRALGNDNVRVLVKDSLGLPQPDEDGILSRSAGRVTWGKAFGEDAFTNALTDSSEIGGVVGTLDGDSPDGPTIALFGDLDALHTGHHCGHNAHLGALIGDATLMANLKRQGVKLPFRKIVFLARTNEEGLAKTPFSDAKEMLDAGLLDIIGDQPNVVLSAHVLPSLRKGEVIIDRGAATHAAGFFSVNIENQATKDYVPPEVVMARITKRISESWDGENVRNSRARLIRSQSHTLSTIVRVADIGAPNEKRDSSRMKSEKETILLVQANQQSQIGETMQKLKGDLLEWEKETGILYSVNLNGDQLKITIKAPGGHISEAGANVEYINATILTALDDAGVKWQRKDELSSSSMSGTVRLKTREWQKKGASVIESISQIVRQEAENAGYNYTMNGSVVVPPVENSPQLRRIAEDLVEAAPLNQLLRPGQERLIAGYAEPFSFWQKLLDAEALLLWIGTGDPAIIDGNKGNADPTMRLHNEAMIVSQDAIPYIGFMGLLALQIGKQYSQV